eukprot:scaffold115749_cov70-Phaeocystis_antarctica.AAC.2
MEASSPRHGLRRPRRPRRRPRRQPGQGCGQLEASPRARCECGRHARCLVAAARASCGQPPPPPPPHRALPRAAGGPPHIELFTPPLAAVQFLPHELALFVVGASPGGGSTPGAPSKGLESS